MEVLEALAEVGVVGPTGSDVLSQARAALASAIADEEHAVSAGLRSVGPDVPGPLQGARRGENGHHARRRRHVVTARRPRRGAPGDVGRFSRFLDAPVVQTSGKRR